MLGEKELLEILTFGDENGTMATQGSLGEFSSSTENWTNYIKRLEQYFMANDINADEVPSYLAVNMWVDDLSTNPYAVIAGTCKGDVLHYDCGES